MSWCCEDVCLDAYYNFEAYVYMEFDTFVDYDSDLDVDHTIDVSVDIDGNEATWNVDAQAFGEDTAVEVNVVAITSDDYSSVTTSGYSAVA
jgi:hypothetical protein